MKRKNLNHSFARLCALVLALALLLSSCGTGAGTDMSQGTGGNPEPAGQDTEEGWKPTASVNLIVGYAAGGSVDSTGRAIAQYIDLDGQTMYITNIEGGAGTIGAMEAYHADNDGLTLLLASYEPLSASYVDGTLPENLCKEMTWAASLLEDPYVISAAADSPYESLEDVIAAVKANPGSLSLAGTGTGAWKVAELMLRRGTGAEFNRVPYDSASKARTAVLGGHEDLYFGTSADVKPYADSGEMRVLAIMSEERCELIPDAPTFKESGYEGLVFGVTRCVGLPPETDEEIARYYEGKLKEVFENEEFQSLMRDTLGFNTIFTGRDELVDKINAAVEWAGTNASSVAE